MVPDRGPGIDELHPPTSERASVLLPGVRGSGAAGAGDGLGLHVCEEAVHAQSGRLEIAGRLGGGTAVSFTLPLTEPIAITPARVAG